MKRDVVMIRGNVAVATMERSDAPDPRDRTEEDALFAMLALEEVRGRYGPGAMMEALPVVAAMAGARRDSIFEAWARHNVPSLLVEAGMDEGAVLASWIEAALETT